MHFAKFDPSERWQSGQVVVDMLAPRSGECPLCARSCNWWLSASRSQAAPALAEPLEPHPAHTVSSGTMATPHLRIVILLLALAAPARGAPDVLVRTLARAIPTVRMRPAAEAAPIAWAPPSSPLSYQLTV